MPHVLSSLSVHTAFSFNSNYSLNGLKKVSTYLQKYFDITIEDDFEQELVEAWVPFSKEDNDITFSTYLLDNVCEVAKGWKKFLVDSTSLDDLVKYALLSLAKSHAAIFSVRFLQRNGFNFVPNDIGMSFSHVIDQYGNVKEVR